MNRINKSDSKRFQYTAYFNDISLKYGISLNHKKLERTKKE